jgi:hypothetical protein
MTTYQNILGAIALGSLTALLVAGCAVPVVLAYRWIRRGGRNR